MEQTLKQVVWVHISAPIACVGIIVSTKALVGRLGRLSICKHWCAKCTVWSLFCILTTWTVHVTQGSSVGVRGCRVRGGYQVSSGDLSWPHRSTTPLQSLLFIQLKNVLPSSFTLSYWSICGLIKIPNLSIKTWGFTKLFYNLCSLPIFHIPSLSPCLCAFPLFGACVQSGKLWCFGCSRFTLTGADCLWDTQWDWQNKTSKVPHH